MCDERVASKLANFNSSKRNGLGPQMLKYMAQLHDWWTYGLEAPQYLHTAKLALPAPPKAPTIRLAAPTISDLLNPAPSSGEEQEITFILDDPYGANQMVDEDDGDCDDMLHVTRGMDLGLLGIEEYMDLSKTKLRARFDESVTHPASTPSSFVTTLSTTTATVEATFANAAWASGFAW
jgi:hypothetical protein